MISQEGIERSINRYQTWLRISAAAVFGENPKRGKDLDGLETHVFLPQPIEEIKKEIYTWAKDKRFPSDEKSPKPPMALFKELPEEVVDCAEMIGTLETFTDDHWESIHDIYFPREEIKGLFNDLATHDGELDAKTQLDLAAKHTGGEIWNTFYLLAITNRIVARNHDKRMFPDGWEPDLEKSIGILKNMPAMEDSFDMGLNTVGGDWYHLWTKIALSYALEDRKMTLVGINQWNGSYRGKFALLQGGLMNNSAVVTTRLRSVFSPSEVVVGDHKLADRMGDEIGHDLVHKLRT